jgi:hypothetical protein
VEVVEDIQMKKSEIKIEEKRSCDINITDKEARAILKDLEAIEYKVISEQTERLKKYLKEIADTEDNFKGKIEGFKIINSDSVEINGTYFGNCEINSIIITEINEWYKLDLFHRYDIEMLKKYISEWPLFVKYIKKNVGYYNYFNVVIQKDLLNGSSKIYINGDLFMEE